jgi:hypothetical protein
MHPWNRTERKDTATACPGGKLRRADVERDNQSQDFAAVWISDS